MKFCTISVFLRLTSYTKKHHFIARDILIFSASDTYVSIFQIALNFLKAFLWYRAKKPEAKNC